MNEKERELRQKMAAKNEEIRGLMNEGKLDDAEQATEELRRLKRELQVEITLGENSVDTAPPPTTFLLSYQCPHNILTTKSIWLFFSSNAFPVPISSELLADTDQNLLNYLYRWLAKKDTITRNTEIAKLINTLTKKPSQVLMV